MAKKKTDKTDQPGETQAPPRRRAAASRKGPAAAPMGVATISGTEPLHTAGDTGALAEVAEPAAPAAPRLDVEPTHGEIAEAAYFRHLKRGGAPGREIEDWIEAERELRERKR